MIPNWLLFAAEFGSVAAMGVVLELSCSDHLCDELGRFEAPTAPAVVNRSRDAGRRAARGDDSQMTTFCPSCAEDFLPQPERKCHQKPPYKLPVADLVGHDAVGHRLSRKLAREGYGTVLQVMKLADEGALDLFLGEKAVARIEAVLSA
ncbi:hypothetical protein [Streptomyces sp. NPDC088789]|uniref:hypothetical protein n=1 Tax=Streptomyces sp. NPDC088789 TaxID=3365899 RepID=UPI003807F852